MSPVLQAPVSRRPLLPQAARPLPRVRRAACRLLADSHPGSRQRSKAVRHESPPARARSHPPVPARARAAAPERRPRGAPATRWAICAPSVAFLDSRGRRPFLAAHRRPVGSSAGARCYVVAYRRAIGLQPTAARRRWGVSALAVSPRSRLSARAVTSMGPGHTMASAVASRLRRESIPDLQDFAEQDLGFHLPPSFHAGAATFFRARTYGCCGPSERDRQT